jgi:hypothetical protein
MILFRADEVGRLLIDRKIASENKFSRRFSYQSKAALRAEQNYSFTATTCLNGAKRIRSIRLRVFWLHLFCKKGGKRRKKENE